MDEAARRVLSAASGVEVTTMPDGSVDHRYRVIGEAEAPLSRTAFADELSGGAKTFMLDHVATEPGGMAVNAAIQTDALGATTRLLGHLDHAVFDDLAFETESMGEPADVNIYDFDESAVMLTDESSDLESWTFRDVRHALDDRLGSWFDADTIVCSNWASIPDMTGFLEDLATTDLTDGWFIVDPGDVTVRTETDIVDFVTALSALDDSFDVVLNPNDTEVRVIGGALGLSATSVTELLAEIRAAADITAAVVHAAPEAAVATRRTTVRVPNYDTRGPVRFTGGGDRFTGGLATALATGARWEVALSVANACATHYVASGATADSAGLEDFPEVAPATSERPR